MEFNFGKLEAQNDTVDYANRVYAITKKFPKDEIFGEGHLFQFQLTLHLYAWVFS